MPQLAGFRGALWDASKVDLAKLVAEPIEDCKARLGRGELVRDTSRAVYRYHQTFVHDGRTLTRKAMFAAMSLVPWSDGSIRAHEVTDPAARQLASAGIADAGIHTEAVFAGYRDAPNELDRLLRKAEAERPTIAVTTADGTAHRLWRVSSAETIGKIRPLFAPKKLHVLDGHARYEGMLAYQARFADRALPMYSSANYGLACLVNLDDPALVVTPRHRIVRAASLTRDAVIELAKKHFLVEKVAGAAKDVAKQRAALADTVAHQPAFVALFAGDADAWKLTLSPDVSPMIEGVKIDRTVQRYDPIVVEHLFLGRVAPGVASETTLDAAAVGNAVAGGAELGVVMRPMTIDQILNADKLGALLPFGSTAFTPAIANLVALVIDPDEDLG